MVIRLYIYTPPLGKRHVHFRASPAIPHPNKAQRATKAVWGQWVAKHQASPLGSLLYPFFFFAGADNERVYCCAVSHFNQRALRSEQTRNATAVPVVGSVVG